MADAADLAQRMAVLWQKLLEAKAQALKDCEAHNFSAGMNGYFVGMSKAVALARYWFFHKRNRKECPAP
jgi:hypothetical protein